MKQQDFLLKNQEGQTIVEALIGFTLIAMVGFALVGGMVSMRNVVKNTAVLSSSDKQITDIAENIKAGVENYQINFDEKSSLSEVLDPEKLPMAWDSGKIAPREDCPSCGGTYGYDIRQNEKYKGLYDVTLRMTHKSWKEKGEPFRDYNFVVSAK